MIEIGTDKHNLILSDKPKVEDRLIKHTCKTNLSPHLLFRNIYTDNTSKVFIGNWTDNGFWITRYRKQFINFRADVVAKGTFKEANKKLQLNFNYSLGFSSVVGGLFIILFITLMLTSFGLNFFVAILFPVTLYVIFSKREMKKAKDAIEKYLLYEDQEE